MDVIGIIFIFIVIISINLKDIVKESKNNKNYAKVYFIIIAIGLTISILQVIDKVPISPSKIIEFIVNKVVK